MSKIKQYFEDYAVAQKACNEFNKKHWKGTIIYILVIWIITFGGWFAYAKIQERKENKLIEDILNKDHEGES